MPDSFRASQPSRKVLPNTEVLSKTPVAAWHQPAQFLEAEFVKVHVRVNATRLVVVGRRLARQCDAVEWNSRRREKAIGVVVRAF